MVLLSPSNIQNQIVKPTDKSIINHQIALFWVIRTQIQKIYSMRREENLPKVGKVMFRVMSGIQARGEASPLIPATCRAFQVITVLAYLIIAAFDLVPVFLSPDNSYVWSLMRLSLAIFGFVWLGVIGTVLVIEYRLFNEMGVLQEHKALLKATSVTATIAYFICQITYLLGGSIFMLSIGQIDAIQAQDYVMLITCSILFALHSVVILTRRIFGPVAALVPLIIAVSNPVISVIALFVLSAVCLYREGSSSAQHRQLQRLYYFVIAVTCIWAYLQMQYTESPQYIVALLNLAFLVSAVFGSFFAFPSLFACDSLLNDNRRLLRWHKTKIAGELAGNQQNNEVNLNEEMLYEKHLQEMEHYRLMCYSTAVRTSAVSTWKEQDRTKVLWERLKLSKDTDCSFQMALFYFRASFSLRVNIPSLLRDMAVFLDKNRGLGLEHSYEVYKLTQQVFRRFEQSGSGSDTALQVADVVQAQRHYHQFYKQLDKLLLQLVEFWKEVLANDFQINGEIEMKIASVDRLKRKARESLSQLKAYHITEEERLYGLVREVINGFEGGGDQVQRMGGEKGNSFEYVVLEGEEVRKVSLKLLKSLGYEAGSAEVHSLRTLLPANFHAYLDQLQRRYLQRDQLREFVLPVLHSSGCFVLKQCLMYLVPHTGSAVQYLITFTGNDMPSQACLLYNVKRQKLQLFNAGFREFIGMRLDAFKEFASGADVLFSSDVFQTQLGTDQLTQLRSHQLIKTKVVYGDFYLRKNSRFNFNDQVTLHLQHQFSFSGQNYLLLAVQSQSFRQAKLQTQAQQTNPIRGRQKQLHEQYAHQEFFCRIQNPYKSKIVQKLSNIRTRSYKSFFYQILAIKITLLVLVIVNCTVYNILSRSLINSGLTSITVMFNLNNEFNYMSRLFSGTYSNQLFTHNPNKTYNYLNYNFYNNNATATVLKTALTNITSYYKNYNDKNSQYMMTTYLLYKPGVENHKQITYTLVFDQFNITTNTLLASFYDIIVEVEQGYRDGTSVNFLVKNYDTMMSLLPNYQQYQAFAEDYTNQFQILEILGFIFIVVLTLSIIVSFLSTVKMIKIHEEMHLLYKFIEKTDVKKIIKELSIIKQSIGNINTQTQDQISHKSYEELLTKQELQEASSRDIQEMSIEQKRQKRQLQEKTFIKAVYKTFKYIYFCPILFASAWLMIYSEYSNMVSNQQEYALLANFIQKIQVDLTLIQKAYADLFQPQLYYLQFGRNYTSQSTTIIKNQFYSQDIPDIFSRDVSMQESLCQPLYVNSINIPFFTRTIADCKAMQLGIMTKGYSSALEFYQSYLRDQQKLTYENFLTTNASMSNKMKDIIFIKEVLFNYLKTKKNNFILNYSTYINQNIADDLNIFVLSLIACLALLVVLLYNIVTLQRMMHTVINLICAIPATAMYRMPMTNYIRKEGILAKMDKL